MQKEGREPLLAIKQELDTSKMNNRDDGEPPSAIFRSHTYYTAIHTHAYQTLLIKVIF